MRLVETCWNHYIMVETTTSSEKNLSHWFQIPFFAAEIHHLRPRCWKSRISHAISTLGSDHLVLRPVTFSGGLKTSLIFCWKMLEELGWKYPWNPVVDHQISIISFPLEVLPFGSIEGTKWRHFRHHHPTGVFKAPPISDLHQAKQNAPGSAREWKRVN